MVAKTVIRKATATKLFLIFQERCGNFEVHLEIILRFSSVAFLIFDPKFNVRIHCDKALAQKLCPFNVYFKRK